MASATLTGSEHEGQADDITGPAALSNFEIADILSLVTGKQIRYVPVSDDDSRNGMQAAGLPDWLIEALIELMVIKRAGLSQMVSLDLEAVIGRQPISFAQFAKDHIEAFK